MNEKKIPPRTLTRLFYTAVIHNKMTSPVGNKAERTFLTYVAQGDILASSIIAIYFHAK